MLSKKIFSGFKSKAEFYSLFFLCFLLTVVSPAIGAEGHHTNGKKNLLKRSDVITIDLMRKFGDLEEPAVNFFHEKHTEALVRNQNDCRLCHLIVKNKLSLKFLRTRDKSKQEVLNIYHTNCIGCHEKTPGGKSPVSCRDCHKKKPEIISNIKPLNFDKSLHFRHTDALENKCSECHHEYDKKSEQLVYKKGQESSCGYCHKQTIDDKRIPIRLAAHKLCISCHVTMRTKDKSTGPFRCGGCHELKQQKQIEKVANPPRLMRKQPDEVLIKTGSIKIDDMAKNRMDFVQFNHKRHEKSNNNCKICHHKAFSSCTQCHSLEGKKEGGGVALEQAMHNPESPQSCIGCHNIKKQDKNCLGCHAHMPVSKPVSKNTCIVCHKNSFDINGAKPDKLFETLGDLSVSDIPEKIIIKKLSDRYKAVNFPHGKIIASLEKKINESQLATSFHNKNGLVCNGCHHNQPVTKKPSACSTCHDALKKKKQTDKPGLMAAYHIQCMECHENMKIGKTGCTDCHEKK